MRSFARHLHEIGHCGPLTVEVMTDWARRDSHDSTDPVTWARRLKRLRTFVRWLQQFEPDTEVPDDTVFGRMPERKAPHIYSEQEVIDLLASARRLGPASSLRGVIFETLFGLIASTGLRISEALSPKNADVDLKTGMLSVRLTKNGQVAPGARASQHPRNAESISPEARHGGRVLQRRHRILRRQPGSTAGPATG